MLKIYVAEGCGYHDVIEQTAYGGGHEEAAREEAKGRRAGPFAERNEPRCASGIVAVTSMVCRLLSEVLVTTLKNITQVCCILHGSTRRAHISGGPRHWHQ